MSCPVAHLVVGPREHGVVRYARMMAAALEAPTVVADTVDGLADRLPRDGRRVHIHFTDRLFGRKPDSAAAQFVTLASAVRGPVGVTLHDVPQTSDGTAFAHRARAYRRVIGAADGVIVCSDHERRLLAEVIDPLPDVRVVPVAIEPRVPRPIVAGPARADVAVLGFLYPGKGHAEVLAAMEVIADRGGLGFLVIGRASDGHDDLIDELRWTAAEMGVRFDITGFVDDDALPGLLQSVAIPVAGHRHVSASGSIATWVGVGRRPLVPRNRYTEEIEARSPGTLWVHEDTEAGLRTALRAAVDDPERTWLAHDAVVYPTLTQAAARHTALFAEWST